MPGATATASGSRAAPANGNPILAMHDFEGEAATVGEQRIAASVRQSPTLAAGYHDATLGYVELRAHLDSSGVHAAIEASSPEAGAMLAGHVPALTDWLERRQTPIESISIVSGSEGLSGGDASQHRSPSSNADRQSHGSPGELSPGGRVTEPESNPALLSPTNVDVFAPTVSLLSNPALEHARAGHAVAQSGRETAVSTNERAWSGNRISVLA